MPQLRQNHSSEDDKGETSPETDIEADRPENLPKQKSFNANDLQPSQDNSGAQSSSGLFDWIGSLLGGKDDTSLRETIEEYVENGSEHDLQTPSISNHERTLIANILKLRDLTVFDIMIPRADIVALDVATNQSDLLQLLSEHQFSRIPVYQGTLDDVLGTIHIKDILAKLALDEPVVIQDLIREVPIVAPSLHVLDLLLQMRHTRKHMAMVVDEYGGIDGLVTLSHILETIIGHIEDEHDPEQEPFILIHDDGSIHADARLDLSSFEERFEVSFSPEDKQDNDTLGGLVFSIANRVPARGEVLSHPSGLVFEIMDADPRRVKLLKITHLEKLRDADEAVPE